MTEHPGLAARLRELHAEVKRTANVIAETPRGYSIPFGAAVEAESAEYALAKWCSKNAPAIIAALEARPPATEGEVERVCKPWREGSLEIPEWDSPLHEVFQAGMSYTANLLAKRLGVTHYEACEGTESIDGDATGSLVNLLIASGLSNADGDFVEPHEYRAAISASRPSGEAKLREGEVEAAAQRMHAHLHEGGGPPWGIWSEMFPADANRVRGLARAAISDTQKASET